MKKCTFIFPILVSLLMSSMYAAADGEAMPAACRDESDKPVAIYLVRHAEKVTGNADLRDPPLTAAGRERAKALARVLSAQPLQAIYSSDYQRTRETAVPVAAQQQVSLTLYDPRALADLAADLCHSTGVALVVGHSNTTPQLVALLGGDGGSAIDEASEFDRLYLVVRSGGQVSSFLMRYGDAVPAP